MTDRAAFAECGFDTRLITALIAFGYTHPQQLLPLTARELTWIPDVGPKGRSAIRAYQERGPPPQA